MRESFCVFLAYECVLVRVLCVFVCALCVRVRLCLRCIRMLKYANVFMHTARIQDCMHVYPRISNQSSRAYVAASVRGEYVWQTTAIEKPL